MRYFIILCVAFLFANQNCPASWVSLFGKPTYSWSKDTLGQYQFIATDGTLTEYLKEKGCDDYILTNTDFALQLASSPSSIARICELYNISCHCMAAGKTKETGDSMMRVGLTMQCLHAQWFAKLINELESMDTTVPFIKPIDTTAPFT